MTSDSSNINVAEPDLVGSAIAPQTARLSDFGLFLAKFIAKGRTISSAVPSSPAMVASVLEHVDFSRPGTIVELGAGTGPVTEQIVEQLRPHHRFVAVENDPDFCDVLRRRFPDITLLQADATRIADPLANLGIHKVDYVLSGLPTPNLPGRGMIRLSRWLRKVLAPDGVFIQITVAPMLYRGFYSRIFESVGYRMVWLNIPPGGVYRCSVPRRHLRKTR